VRDESGSRGAPRGTKEAVLFSPLFLRTLVLIGVVVLFSCAAASAACGSGDPAGHYEGTAISHEAGTLKVSLDLRCDQGRYGGSIVTPVGTFQILDGSYANKRLDLRFGGGAIGDTGKLSLNIDGDSATGTFGLGADSGSFDLKRLGEARAPAPTTPDLNISKEQWRDDLKFLLNELTTKHVNPFQYTPRESLLHQAASLDAEIAGFDADHIYMGMDHIANLVGDGHTYVEFPPDLALFPVSLRRFGSDYRVVEATGDGARALGMRVLAINGSPIADVRDRLYSAITPIGETPVLRDARAQNFLRIGMALHGIGIIPQRDRATFTVANDAGLRSEVSLAALTPAQADSAQWMWVWPAPPLYEQQPRNDFWYTYLAPEKTVYLSFRGYENLASLAPAFMDFVRAKRPQKIVIDLRLNSGGDYKVGLNDLIEPIAGLKWLNRKGHLFVLVGANTFSAAMSNAAQFRTMTLAMLVGQTIGERPNSSQEANEDRLPNSHLLLRYSTQRYTFLPGRVNEIIPDKVIFPTWQDFKMGRDPVLDWVLKK